MVKALSCGHGGEGFNSFLGHHVHTLMFTHGLHSLGKEEGNLHAWSRGATCIGLHFTSIGIYIRIIITKL
jgi:hypothetical protein